MILQRFAIESHIAPNGALFICDDASLGFQIRRVFFIAAEVGAVRGKHAHRRQRQVLMCAAGSILVEAVLPDGSRESVLLSQGYGVEVNPLVWTTQEFCAPDSVLVVICDDTFDESDYIRSFEEFLEVSGRIAR